MSHLQLIQEAAEALTGAQVHRPQWTAEQLLAERLGCLPVDLYVEPPAMESETRAQFRADVAARAGGVPLQYLLGSADFYGRRFRVGPGVFIPRPETEVLVDTALEILRGQPDPIVVDVGTGSGMLAITLAQECPGIKPVAVECSSVALRFARRNAAEQASEVRFMQGDLLGGFAPASVDFVVANLPYLDPAEVSRWPRELAWEPWLALSGGGEGTELMGRLLAQASSVLRPGGRAVLEIGMGQAPAVQAVAQRNGFRVERVVPDLTGLDRLVALWKS